MDHLDVGNAADDKESSARRPKVSPYFFIFTLIAPTIRFHKLYCHSQLFYNLNTYKFFSVQGVVIMDLFRG